MTTPDSQIDIIFNLLESSGFPRSIQSMVLPEWVTPEVLSDAATSSEIAMIIAKRLGLRISSLLAAKPRVELLKRRDIKYKRSIPNKLKNLNAASSIAVSVAESVASACQAEFRSFVNNPKALRQEILKSFPGNWLGLRNLLMACWSHGVPVVYLAEFGINMAKMDGMVVYTDSRPVIILSKSSQLWAWQLFILAHEIAHVALGHVAPNEILVDEELSENFYALKDNDSVELSADRFALELLNNRPNATYTTSDERVNYRELAESAFQYGKAHQIDPGHIALNYANSTGKWNVGYAAAKLLQSENTSAVNVINDTMWQEIDTESLPMDTIDFLAKVTGSKIE